MLHKPVIYVSRITNLSDARYCAGMGVDMLGYMVDSGHPDYVSPEIHQAMAGWIVGPKRVVEITTFDGVDLNEIVNQYKPDLFHISLNAVKKYVKLDLPLIVETSFEDLFSYQSKTQNVDGKIEYLLITQLPSAAGLKFADVKIVHPILLSVGTEVESITDLMKQTGVAGFALQGSRELVPGLKDYDHLSRILEELDS